VDENTAEPATTKFDALQGTAASRRLARILADARALPDDEIISIQKRFPNEYLGDILVRERILLPSYLQSLLIRTLCIPFVAVDGCTVNPLVVELLPEAFCRQHHMMPVSWAMQTVTLACVNPLDEEAIAEVRYVTGLNVRLVLCSQEQLDTLLNNTFVKPETDEEQQPEVSEEKDATDTDQKGRAGSDKKGEVAGPAAPSAPNAPKP